MSALPRPVRDYLRRHTRAKLRPAFLKVADDGVVVELGGDLDHHGLDTTQLGVPAADQVAFLTGLLPLSGRRLVIERVAMPAGTTADVHLLADHGVAWVVILDCSHESRARQALQQRGNDLTLLRTVHGRILDQLLGHHEGAELGCGPVAIRAGGERRVVTTLVADLRGTTRLAETGAPDAVIRALDLYLRTMATSLISEGGLIDEISGDGVQAIFGVLPSTTPSEDLAIRAAHRVLTDVGRIHRNGRAADHPFAGVGIGIATGPAVLGVIGSRERRSFTAVGYHVNLAALLEREAGPGEILIDERTRAAATDALLVFSERRLSLPRLGGEVSVYRVTRRSG